MEQNATFTQAQEAILDYFRRLDPVTAQEKLSHIIKLRDDGAKIEGTELAKIYEKLGYGQEEVGKCTFDFCDELVGIYREVRNNA